MLFLELVEALVIAFLVIEIAVPLIFNMKLFPVLRNLGSKKKLTDVKQELEEALTDRESVDLQRRLYETTAQTREEVNRIQNMDKPTETVTDEIEVENKPRPARRGAKKTYKGE